MLMQSSHSLEDRGLDAYFTPREATISLIEMERAYLPKYLREPASGDGAMVVPLRENGYTVDASDIHDHGFPCRIADYLETHELTNGAEGLVTNPPFKLARQFAEKAIREYDYVALLLRTNFLESESRLSFFREYPPARVLISSRRLPMMHRKGWTGKKSSSNTCFAWFVWDATQDQKGVLNWFDWKETVALNKQRLTAKEW